MSYAKSSIPSVKSCTVSRGTTASSTPFALTDISVHEIFFLDHALLQRSLLKPGDVLWIHRPSSEGEAGLLGGVLALPLSLNLDHGYVFGRLGVLCVEIPLLELGLVLLLTRGQGQSTDEAFIHKLWARTHVALK